MKTFLLRAAMAFFLCSFASLVTTRSQQYELEISLGSMTITADHITYIYLAVSLENENGQVLYKTWDQWEDWPYWVRFRANHEDHFHNHKYQYPLIGGSTIWLTPGIYTVKLDWLDSPYSNNSRADTFEVTADGYYVAFFDLGFNYGVKYHEITYTSTDGRVVVFE
ncbi:MAG: hypothetical protein LUD68_09710 [Rikenellaceae bacterium]|nr:hypothetical protein [Rikenellaceae bacterium]